MKIETMREQLPNSIQFIIDYISSGSENHISKFSCEKVYQDYLEWCGCNREKPLTSKVARKKFSLIGIDQTCSRDNRVRVYQYILDRFKIVTKLRESGLGDMEEFSDIPQPETLKADEFPANEVTDIPIFNVLETVITKLIPTIPQKIILPQPEENLSPRGKKADKQDDLTQALFDYVIEQSEILIASTSGTFKTSNPSEPVIDKLLESIEPISKVVDMSLKETSDEYDSFEPINEVSSAILLSRTRGEERLRKKAVELEEDSDTFVTIIKKDGLDFIAFRNRMETDSRMCAWVTELEDDPKEHMDMTIGERLIGEEIICRSLEKDGIISLWLDTDEKWKKTVSILQENSMLW